MTVVRAATPGFRSAEPVARVAVPVAKRHGLTTVVDVEGPHGTEQRTYRDGHLVQKVTIPPTGARGVSKDSARRAKLGGASTKKRRPRR